MSAVRPATDARNAGCEVKKEPSRRTSSVQTPKTSVVEKDEGPKRLASRLEPSTPSDWACGGLNTPDIGSSDIAG